MKTSQIANIIRLIIQKLKLDYFLPYVTIGQLYSKWWSLITPTHTMYPNSTIRKIRINGINYELHISDLMDWYVYFGFREPSKINFFNCIKKGDVVFDVGANLGQMSLISSQKIGPNGIVYSFEPDPDNFNKLQKNLLLNRYKNINLISTALGDMVGKAEMVVRDQSNTGMNYISVSLEGKLEITTIDDFILNNSITSFDVLKIDTEGFEYKILSGALNSIKRFHPLMYIEIDDNNLKRNGSTPNLVFELLNQNEYSIFHSETLKEINLNESFENCHFDIIAYSKAATGLPKNLSKR